VFVIGALEILSVDPEFAAAAS